MALVDVLIPTCGRKTGLAVVLTSLLGQTFTDFDVVVSCQSDPEDDYLESIEIQTLARLLRWHGHAVSLHRHLPRRGMAEQRHFLLSRSRSRYVHFVDDDVVLDPPALARMLGVIEQDGCGFVGCPATGLGFLGDARPEEERSFEVWHGPVRPEPFEPGALPWERHRVNNAANPLHLEQRCCEGRVVRYKVAWIGGANVLYDRTKLLDVGGFSWWARLPPGHAGEEVVAQFLLIRKYGGCGILPSGTYHLGLPTEVADRRTNATELFEELIREFDVRPGAPVRPVEVDEQGATHV